MDRLSPNVALESKVLDSWERDFKDAEEELSKEKSLGIYICERRYTPLESGYARIAMEHGLYCKTFLAWVDKPVCLTHKKILKCREDCCCGDSLCSGASFCPEGGDCYSDGESDKGSRRKKGWRIVKTKEYKVVLFKDPKYRK